MIGAAGAFAAAADAENVAGTGSVIGTGSVTGAGPGAAVKAVGAVVNVDVDAARA